MPRKLPCDIFLKTPTLAVDFPTVTNPRHEDQQPVPIHAKHNAVVTDPQTVQTGGIGKLAPFRGRPLLQAVDARTQPDAACARQFTKLLERARAQLNRVTHLRR